MISAKVLVLVLLTGLELRLGRQSLLPAHEKRLTQSLAGHCHFLYATYMSASIILLSDE